MNLCRYVHFNLIAAKIATNLDQYQWSSHFYFSQNNALAWMEIKFLLDLIYSNKNQNYFEFINNASECEKWKPTMWITEAEKIEYNKDAVQSLRTSTISLSLTQSFVSLNEVLEKVCFQLCIEKTILLGPSRNRVIAKQRILYAWCLLKYAKLNITDVAELLQRTRSTLRRQLREIELHSEYYFSQETLQAINQLFI